MAKSDPIQTRFDGGKISPRLSGRFDSELYKKALKECSNFEPLAQGSLRMRSGSELEQTLTGDERTKLIQIRMSTGQDYLIELLDKIAHIYSLAGNISVIEQVRQSELITNGNFTDPHGAGWLGLTKVGNWLQDNDTNVAFNDNNGVSTGWGITNTANNGNIPGVLYQQIVVPAAGNIHLQFDMASNITTDGNHMRVKISTSNPVTWVDRWLNGGEAFLYDGQPAGLVAFGSGNPFAATLTHVDLGVVALAAGTYWISFQVPAHYVLTVDNVSFFAVYGVVVADVPTPWTASEAQAVNHMTETGRDRTVFVHPGHHPWALLFGGQAGNWTFGDIVYTSLPVAWGDQGSANVPVGWNWQGQSAALAAANWPSCVDMHDGRIIYGGEPAQKNRIVASRSGSGDDFTLGVNPGDALDFKLATKGSIRWIRSQRTTLVGTDLGSHTVTGSKGTPLVGDTQARGESSNPASAVQAVLAGTKAIYVSADLRRIRAAAFDLQTQGWESKDITFVAEDITAGLVKEIHQAWTPDNVLVALLQDGSLAVVTYEADEQVIAWWTAGVGDTIVSAAASQGPLGAYLWMAVRRNGKTYLEKLHLSESTEQLRYLDASISANSDGAGQVAGLNHLEGRTVRAMVSGGGVLGDFVVAGGVIQLGADWINTTVIVGLPYKARAVTLPRDIKHGKAQSSKLGVILNNSALPLLNGKRPKDRTPSTPMGNAEPLFTGKKTIGNLGWSDEDSITIEQDVPFRTEICALYSSTDVEST